MRKVTLLVIGVLVGIFVSAPFVLGQEWTYLYNGHGSNSDGCYSIVRGSDGNLYTCGYSFANGQGQNFTVISLTESGSQRWIFRLNGWDNLDDYAWAVARGADGFVYAAGVTDYAGFGSGTLTVVKLRSSNGSVVWVWKSKLPQLASGLTGELGSLTIGSDGNLYAAGMGFPGGTGSDITVLSLSSSGSLRWCYNYNYLGRNDCSETKSIVYGSDGNIYAAGAVTEHDYPPLLKMVALSFTPTGSLRWTKFFGGSGYDYGRSIAYGSDSNVYVGGTLGGQMGIASVTNAGADRWTYAEPGSGNGFHVIQGSDGNVYLGGKSGGPPNYAVLSTTSSGTRRWLYSVSGGGYNGATSLCFGNGAVFSAGQYQSQLAMISLWSNGLQNYSHFYHGGGPFEDIAWSLAYKPGTMGINGTSFAGGTASTPGNGWDYLVHAYHRPEHESDGGSNWQPTDELSGKEDAAESQRKNSTKGLTVFPNPFVSSASVPGHEAERFSLYDVSGRQVGTYLGSRIGADVRPGIYFLKSEGKDTAPLRIVKVK